MKRLRHKDNLWVHLVAIDKWMINVTNEKFSKTKWLFLRKLILNVCFMEQPILGVAKNSQNNPSHFQNKKIQNIQQINF